MAEQHHPLALPVLHQRAVLEAEAAVDHRQEIVPPARRQREFDAYRNASTYTDFGRATTHARRGDTREALRDITTF
jgi:hypothetical protein